MKTKLFILAVLVMVLCCITSASAADANMTEIALEEPTDDVSLEASVDIDVIGDEDEKIDAPINITVPDDMKAGGRYVINVTMPKDADYAYIDLFDGDDNYLTDTFMENGTGSFNFVPKKDGNQTFRLNYYGNEIYNKKDYYCPVEIKGFTFSLDVEDSIELQDSLYLSLNVPGGFNQTVTVTINGKKYYASYDEEDEWNSYFFEVNGSDFRVGDNPVNLYYAGGDNFPEINVTDKINIFNRSTIGMTVEYPENIVACQPFEFNVTLSENINTTVHVEYYYDEGWWEEGDSFDVVDGKGTYAYWPYSIRQYSLRFNFWGDETYRPVRQVVNWNVEDYTINFYSPLDYSSEIEFNLWIPSGFYNDVNVTIDDDEYVFTSDDGYSRIMDLDIGNHTVNIYYPGDSEFHMLNVTRTLEIIPFVSVSEYSFPVGADEYISCILPADANGTFVLYYNNGSEFGRADLKDGRADVSFSTLDVGKYNMSVRYEGDAKYTINTNVELDVHPVLEVPSHVLEGDDIIITMNATGGNLTVYDGNNKEIGFSEFSDGVAKINLGKATSSRSIAIKYVNGNYTYDNYYSIYVVDIQLSIKNGSYIPSSLSRFGCYAYGDDYDYSVEFYFDDEYVDRYYLDYDYSYIYLTECNLTEGQHTLEVVVYGLSKKITFNVVSVNVTAPSYTIVGDDSNITIQVPEDLGGNVTAYYYDDYYYEFPLDCEKLADGRFVIPLNDLRTGSNEVYFEYKGDKFNYKDSRSIRTLDIDISIENNTVLSSDAYSFRVNVRGWYGDVDYYFDGNLKSSFSSNWGSETLYFDDGDLINGKHTIEIRFDYNDDTISKKVFFMVISPNITAPSAILVGDNSNITVKLPGELEGNITAYANSKEFYSVKVTDGKAVVPLNSLSANGYSILLKYEDDKFTFTHDLNIMVYDVGISIEKNSVLSQDAESFTVGVNPSFIDYVNYYFDGNLKTSFYPSWDPTRYFDDGDLTNGKHTIEIRFDYGDDTISKKVTFYVVSINVTAPKYNLVGNDSNINVKVPEGFGGNVTAYFKSDEWDSEYEQFAFENIVNDEANISLASLNPGYKHIKLEYRADGVTIVREVQLTVLDMDVSIENNSAVFNGIGSFNVDFKTWCYGELVFKFDGEQKYSYIDYLYQLNIPLGECNLSVGRHTIELIYSDGDYSAYKMIQFNTTSVSIIIPERIAKNNNYEGIGFYAYVMTQSDATGNITCIVDGSPFSILDLWGENVYPIYLAELDAGDHDVEITYSGDDNYPKTTETGKVHVDYLPYIESTSLTYGIDDLIMILPSTDGIVVMIDGNETQYVIDGHNVIVPKSLLKIGQHNVAVENATGTILESPFWVDGRIIWNDQTWEISLTLPNDAKGTLCIEITKLNSTTGQYEKFITEEIPLVDGKAVFENNLIPDFYQYVCNYVGDDYTVPTNYFNTYGEPKYNLDKSEIYVNESAVVSIIVNKNVGNFTISIIKDGYFLRDMRKPIVDNRANITLSGLEYGSYSIQPYYEDEFYSWRPSFTLEVLRYDVDLTTVEVADIDKGQTAFVKMDLPDDATRFVYVYVDGKLAAKVKANATLSISLENLTVGAHAIEVEYEGNFKYAPNSTIRAIIVNDIKLESDINATGCEITEGQTAVINVNVTEDATGLVLVDINGKKYFEEISGGTVTVNIDDLKAGNYTAIVTYNGDDKYNKSSTEAAIRVNEKEDSIIVITNSALSIGESATITATVNGIDADVAYAINGVEGATINLVEATTYTVTASFAGNATHKANSTTKTFTVKKLASDVKVDVKDAKVYETATITVNVTKGATGIVIVSVGDEYYAVDLSEGNVLELELYNASTYDVFAAYLGDDIYDTSASDKAILNITDKAPANISVDDPNDVKVGDVVVINVTADTTADLIAFMDNETLPIVNGTITVAADKEGVYVIEVVAYQNADFYGDSVAVIFNADKKDASVAISLPENITAGEDITISFASDSDAPVVVYIDSVAQNVSDNKVVIKANAGNHTIVAGVAGTDKYNSAAANMTFTVKRVASDVKLDVKDAKVGEVATITVNVTKGAAGVVIVSVGDANYALDLSQGNVLELVTYKAGSYDVVAFYLGDYIYDVGVSDKVTLNISSKAPANISVDDPNDVKVGDVVVINVTADTTADLIAFMDNETLPIVNGTITVAADKEGVYVIEVVAYQNADFYGDSVAVIFNADKKDASVAISLPENITAGEDITISFASDSDAPVVVYIDGVAQNVSDNKLVIKATEGTHTIVASVAETDKFKGAMDSKSFTLESQSSQANVTIGDINVGGDTQLKVDVPGASGNVSFIVDGVETVVPLDENGTAAFTIANTTAGEHSVVVVYSGDDKHAPMHDVATFNAEVFESKFTNITVEGNGLITARLVVLDTPMANAVVTYKVGGVVANVTTDKDGMFSFNATFPATVEISYAGTDAILPVDTAITIKDLVPVRAATSIMGEDFTQYAVEYKVGERGQNFTVKLVDANGMPLANKMVYIGYNGKTLERVSDKNGNVFVQINLKDKNRLTFAAVFLGDENYNASMSVYLVNIIQKPVTISASAKTYKASAKTKKYTVTLKTIQGSSADGNVYFGAKKTVTMRINGNTYTAKTDDSGQATFNLKISKKGKYNAVINYEGDNTYESATKSVKITIK